MSFPAVPAKHFSPEIISADTVLEDWEKRGLFEPTSWNIESAVLIYDRRLYRDLLKEHELKALPFGAAGAYHELAASDGRLVLAGEFGVGAPAAAIVAESLIACGVREIISLGTAGGLQPDLNPGEIVLVTGAVRDDGTSHHYIQSEIAVAPDQSLSDRLELSLKQSSSKAGRVWTTDAPFRETIIELQTHRDAGVLAVEMEAAALMAVCELRDVAFASCVCISDLLTEEGWQALFSATQVRQALITMFDAAVETLMENK